jgi:hypothetical protein
MATKNVILTAKSGDNDISIGFTVAKDGYYEGEVLATVSITVDGQPFPEAVQFVVKDMPELSGAEKTGLRSVLKTIRDAALTELGYV